MKGGSRLERLPAFLRPTLTREVGLIVVGMGAASLALFLGAIFMAHPPDHWTAVELRVMEPYLWGAAATTAALMLAGLLLTKRRVAGPVRRLAAAARAMAEGDYSRRLNEESLFDELGELARCFDAMAARTQETVAHLAAERDFSNALLEHFPEGVAVLGLAGCVDYANPAFRWCFPGGAWEAAAPRLAEVLPSREAAGLVEEALRGRRALLRERVELAPRQAFLRLSLVPVGVPGRERALLIVEDETVEVRAERQKAEWQDMLIHDVKSPLSAVLGMAKALRMTPRPEEEDRLLSHAEAAGERILRLLNTYLDVLRMEAGARALERERVELLGAAAEAAAQVEPLARAAGVALSLEVPPEAALQADREQVVRILVNLLDNAVKYGAEGKRAAVKASPLAGGGWRLVVHDDGPGIAPADLPRLFDRFYRARAGASGGRLGGTGLGLAFCRLAAELHGWRIRAESAPGRGTDMVLEAPAGGARAAA